MGYVPFISENMRACLDKKPKCNLHVRIAESSTLKHQFACPVTSKRDRPMLELLPVVVWNSRSIDGKQKATGSLLGELMPLHSFPFLSVPRTFP
jgi:hypothetical protein